MKYLRVILILLVCAALNACAGTEDGAGRVIDNASEVVQSASKVIWIPPSEAVTPSPTPAH